jgi:hypothetical protein
MPQLRRCAATRNSSVKVLQRIARSGTLPASRRVNRLTGSGLGPHRDRGWDAFRGCRHERFWYAATSTSGTPCTIAAAARCRRKCPLPESSHGKCRSIFRESRGQRHASLKFRFLVEKIMESDTRPPTETVVSLFGLILAAYDSLADSSRCRPFSAENATLPWAVVLRARSSAAVLLGLRGQRDIPRKSFSSE